MDQNYKSNRIITSTTVMRNSCLRFNSFSNKANNSLAPI